MQDKTSDLLLSVGRTRPPGLSGGVAKSSRGPQCRGVPTIFLTRPLHRQ